MAKDRKFIENVRYGIAYAVKNDCLPTMLTTNSLKDICFQYDNYKRAENEKDRRGAMSAIHSCISLINKQGRNAGNHYDIIPVRNESEDEYENLAEAISIIYAIPYGADATIDYVGYAYGMEESRKKNYELYDSFAPDDYINQCSIAVMEYGNKRNAEDLMEKMKDCSEVAEYLESIENGSVTGNRDGILNRIASRIASMDEEIKEICGQKPTHKDNVIVTQAIAEAMRNMMRYSGIGAIEKERESQTQTGISEQSYGIA